MLTHLSINNFVLIDKCVLEWFPGMTVITGETGAGKSIILDALELILGKRAEKTENKADMSATFDIDHYPAIQQFLTEKSLGDNTECFVRRTLTPDGRSRCFINDNLVPLQSLRELGNLLMTLHGQHEHQSLLSKEYHRQWLDNYGHHGDLTDKVKSLHQAYKKVQQELEICRSRLGDRNSRLEFLSYQMEELSQLDLSEASIKKLEEDHKMLTHSKEYLETFENLENLLAENLLPMIHQGEQSLIKLPEIKTYFENARIQLEEGLYEIQQKKGNLDTDPASLAELENQLNKIYTLSRKHRVKPLELEQFSSQLQKEWEQLKNSESILEKLQQESEKIKTEYLDTAKKLSERRKKAAPKMSAEIEQFIHALHMKGAKFEIQFTPYEEDQLSATGLEKIEFIASLNPGQPLAPLIKIASGGELSRISLAIHLIAARDEQLPTLIFDEVDVGIGGATAAKVGQLLKTLSEKAQVICITHLPQVASLGTHHLHVEKKITKNKTTTDIHYLTQPEKIQEIARMLGGLKITAQTLAHAEELLDQ